MASPKRNSLNRGADGAPSSILKAADDGDIETVKAILAVYPQAIHEKDETGFTPLHFGCYHSDTELVLLLLSHPGVNCHAPDAEGRWPVHHALSSPSNELKAAIKRATFRRYPDIELL